MKDNSSAAFSASQLRAPSPAVKRRLRYHVAASLDGFIAGPHGEYDWIVPDPAIDFAGLYREFDVAVMGRKTYELLTSQGESALPDIEIIVFSRTLTPAIKRGVRITDDNPIEVVRSLKEKKGRDIWLFGGGVLFRWLVDAGLVDTVEVAVMPVLLGTGIPLLPLGGRHVTLRLADHHSLATSGVVVLEYEVQNAAVPAVRG